MYLPVSIFVKKLITDRYFSVFFELGVMP